MESLPFCFFVFLSDMTDTIIPKNTRATITCLEKNNKRGRLFICVHVYDTRMRFKHEVKISDLSLIHI